MKINVTLKEIELLISLILMYYILTDITSIIENSLDSNYLS